MIETAQGATKMFAVDVHEHNYRKPWSDVYGVCERRDMQMRITIS